MRTKHYERVFCHNCMEVTDCHVRIEVDCTVWTCSVCSCITDMEFKDDEYVEGKP
jgi:RNase P subunit RPR2